LTYKFYDLTEREIFEVAHQPNEYSLISNTLGDAKVFAHVAMEG
jgi:acetylornithine deacetylase/succinyl-diaminopimelate desuccinylase-like protein